jgi:hypothetical protein
MPGMISPIMRGCFGCGPLGLGFGHFLWFLVRFVSFHWNADIDHCWIIDELEYRDNVLTTSHSVFFPCSNM